jgi:hypothetical protein
MRIGLSREIATCWLLLLIVACAPTYSPLRTCPLSISVFSDHNGNGQQEGGEPPLEGIGISLGTPKGPQVIDCASDDNGMCELGHLSLGNYVLSVHDPSGTYGWITPSLEELLPISRGWPISLTHCQAIAVPLRQVPGTSPICGSPFVLLYGFDHNRVKRYQSIGTVTDRFSGMIVNWSFADHIHLEFNAGLGQEDPFDYMAVDGALYCPEGTARMVVYSPVMEGHYEKVMGGQWP